MMNLNYNIGDMYNLRLVYVDKPDQSKMRPIVIIEVDDDDFIYIKFTSQGPKNDYSRYEKLKKSFPNWRKNHLDRDSWFINQGFILTRKDFESLEKEYLGKISKSDFHYILRELDND